MKARNHRSHQCTDRAIGTHNFAPRGALILGSGVPRVADYVLRELIDPLRGFLRARLLSVRQIDLWSGRSDRRVCIEAVVDAARRGLIRNAKALLGRCVSVFACAIAPRDRGLRPASGAPTRSPVAAVQSLCAVR